MGFMTIAEGEIQAPAGARFEGARAEGQYVVARYVGATRDEVEGTAVLTVREYCDRYYGADGKEVCRATGIEIVESRSLPEPEPNWWHRLWS